jgi:hypothetical protein
MKYLMLLYGDETAWAAVGEEERRQVLGEFGRIYQELLKNDQYKGGSPLQPVSAATTVRVRNGKRLVTDGPFAETKEQLGGYFLIEAADLDTALAIAATIPSARYGSVEVRPVLEIHDLKG